MFLLGTLFSVNAQVPNYIPTNGLVGWYPFNGNANDESGNGRNGTINGPTISSDRIGKSNSVYDFDGTNDFISVSNTPFNNSPFTISAWIYVRDVNNSFNPIVGLGDFSSDYLHKLYFSPNGNGTGKPQIGTQGLNDITSTSNAISINNWKHIVLVFNSYSNSGIQFYVNGVLLSSNTTGGSNNPTPLNATGFNIGKHTMGNGTNYFNGKIDELGLWNRALSSSEITDLYIGCQLSISTEPANQSSSINAQAQFNVASNDTTSSYQWQSNASNLGWVNIPSSSFYSGVTSKKLTVNNIQVNNQKQLFRVIATKNTCKDTSVVAMLTVNDTCITNVYDTIVTSTTDTLYIKVNTSSLSNPVYNTVKVYPNPSSTKVIIDNGNYSTMGTYTAKIVNSIGQQVFQSVINQQQFVIDANSMGGVGVYTLYITDANNKVVGVKKIVLQ